METSVEIETSKINKDDSDGVETEEDDDDEKNEKEVKTFTECENSANYKKEEKEQIENLKQSDVTPISSSEKIEENKLTETEVDEQSTSTKHEETIEIAKIKNSEEKETDEYADHITYVNNIAIYTDPTTKVQYQWDRDQNQWVNINDGEKKVETQTEGGEKLDSADNVYENEHYRWDAEKNEWILKDSDINQNEFYTWCETSNKWIPKIQMHDIESEYIDGVHTYTDKDGAIFFWDETKNAWFPKVDDDFIARYQMSYGFIDNVTPVNTEVPEKIHSIVTEKENPTVASAAAKRKAQQEPPTWFELNPQQNTKVYVSNLPFEITEEEFINLMSKCGLIVRDPQTQKMKVKLYKDSNGMLKGDALCDYIRMESVELALNLLDGSDVNGKKISVQRAEFQMRGEYNPALKPKKKKKEKEKLKKIQEKLFDWRPERMRGERAKHERVVIIKNLFTPELFEKEVHLIIDYQKDLREECSKCGKVRKVIVYDRHPEGIAQISMGDAEEADVVVQLLNGRYFGSRKLIAELWDGHTKYKIGETESENTQRLTNWDKFLESDEVCDVKVTDSDMEIVSVGTKEEELKIE